VSISTRHFYVYRGFGLKKFEQIENLQNRKEEIQFDLDNTNDWDELELLTHEYMSIDMQLQELISRGEGKKLYENWKLKVN